jgi:uncharacterized lipoprotein YddW (UPF0748 family)
MNDVANGQTRRRMAASLALLGLIGGLWGIVPAAEARREPVRERHSLWVHPPDVGTTREAVEAFADRCRRARIDTIIVLVKGMNGEIYWPSRRFSETVVKTYASFDMLGELTKAAHARGMKVHAWLCDFVEGQRSAAVRAHPEWVQLNPDGGTTATETLGPRRRPYPYVWMCPARRPGYTDQWLLPMIEELVRQYAIDGIHHDYVRYPGDVAPDSFCFCDYCLTAIPRYAMLAYETRADERYGVDRRQERIEANWWTDPTMIPPRWSAQDRRERADFLLNGRTIPGGAPDIRYFFYDFRVAQIDRFVREAHALVKRINPKVELSASVFKNPVQSARFIGQQWHRWQDSIDVYTPMTYRSHFAGSFASYVDHLEETTRRQLEWIDRARPIEAGIASTYLYREEMKPIDDISDALIVLSDPPRAGRGSEARAAALTQLTTAFDRLRTQLTALRVSRAAEQAATLAPLVAAVERADQTGTPAAIADLTKAIAALRADLPEGFCPPQKLVDAIAAARRAQPDGVAIFSAGSLKREKLWPTLEQAFSQQ